MTMDKSTMDIKVQEVGIRIYDDGFSLGKKHLLDVFEFHQAKSMILWKMFDIEESTYKNKYQEQRKLGKDAVFILISQKPGHGSGIVVSDPVYVNSKTKFHLRYGKYVKDVYISCNVTDSNDFYRIADDFSSIVLESSGE